MAGRALLRAALLRAAAPSDDGVHRVDFDVGLL
jgi:hypothetical protein